MRRLARRAPRNILEIRRLANILEIIGLEALIPRRVELVLISLGRFARQRLDAVLALVEIIGAQLVVAVLFEQTQMRTRSRLRTLFVRAPFRSVAQARHFVPLALGELCRLDKTRINPGAKPGRGSTRVVTCTGLDDASLC